tara:strand:+ start:426 stop:587 length:162 start_codon:yes stop_codon:yes gene_type:complete
MGAHSIYCFIMILWLLAFLVVHIFIVKRKKNIRLQAASIKQFVGGQLKVLLGY